METQFVSEAKMEEDVTDEIDNQINKIKEKIDGISPDKLMGIIMVALLVLLILLVVALGYLIYFSYQYDALSFQLQNLTQNCIPIEPIKQTGGELLWNISLANV